MMCGMSRLAVAVFLVLIANCAKAQVLGDLNCVEDANRCPSSITTVYAFSNTNSVAGYTPMAGLVRGNDGNLYGTTFSGGAPNQFNGAGYGTVFKISPAGEFTVLHAFAGGADGQSPNTAMVKGPDGSLWGVTGDTGVQNIFRIGIDGSYTSFPLPYWAYSIYPLCFGSDGNIYGTSYSGSGNGPGTFFSMTTDGVATLLHTFGTADGIFHPGPVVQGRDGYFYGASGRSMIRLSPSGDLTTTMIVPASSPLSASGTPLTLGSNGNFYGVTTGQDTVFQLTSSGTVTVLLNLSNSYISGSPASVVQGSDGNFYGATNAVFQMAPDGTLTVLFPFFASNSPVRSDGLSGGASQLMAAPDGLYGTFPQGGDACQGQTDPLCRPYGIIFRINVGGGTGNQVSSPSSAALSPPDAIDPNNDQLRPLLPLTSLGNTWNTDSYYGFGTSGSTVNAIAADGVTPLILRWHLSQPGGTVTFSVADSTCAGTNPATPCENTGTLSCLDSNDCVTSPNGNVMVTAQEMLDGTGMAFAMLKAPVDFVRPGYQAQDIAALTRTINVTAKLNSIGGSAPQQGTLPISLWRPPVVLLHGLWSNACTWKWSLPNAPHFFVYEQDYEATHASRFAVNLFQPQRGIQAALASMRKQGTAVTQADFVGHSMGGILARLYAGAANPNVPYQRPDNLGFGDMHKLITLDTPHFGSSLANALVDLNGNDTDLGTAFEAAQGLLSPSPPCRPTTKPSDLIPPMCATCGAIFDLRTDSAALSNMPEVLVPSHVIVGVGGSTAISDFNDFATAEVLLGGPIAIFAEILGGTAGLLQTDYFGGQRHDLIVSEPSQLSGVTNPDQISTFDAQLPAGPWATHMTVTAEDSIGAAVEVLLNTAVGSTSFGPLPATGTSAQVKIGPWGR